MIGDREIITAEEARRLGITNQVSTVLNSADEADACKIEKQLGDIVHARVKLPKCKRGQFVICRKGAPVTRESAHPEPAPANHGMAGRVSGSSDDTYPRIGGRKHF